MTAPAQPSATPPADGATPPTGTPATTPPVGGTTPPTTTPPADADGLGEAGRKALAEERAARKELEKQLAALTPLKGLADVLGVKPESKTDVQALTDQVSTMQRELVDERLGRLRLEVAAEKGLTPAQAARLNGATRDELTADADQLRALFPAQSSGTPGTPAPDPTQGARGGAADLQAAIKAAEQKGDLGESIRLKTQLALGQPK